MTFRPSSTCDPKCLRPSNYRLKLTARWAPLERPQLSRHVSRAKVGTRKESKSKIECVAEGGDPSGDSWIRV